MKRLPLALLFILPLLAYGADPSVPSAGTMLQQIQPVSIPGPSSIGTGLTVERKGIGQLPASAPFLVRTLRITGNSHFPTATLQALVTDADGRNLTLPQLNAIVARITQHYHRHGFPLAQAIIPAQEIQNGLVVVEVIEARYGTVKLDNQSRVSNSLLRDTLAPLQSGQTISQSPLDHALLLLSDIPGITVNATLKPGQEYGTSDLLVGTKSDPFVSGYLVLDYFGNRYTGRTRLGVTLNINEPFGRGDVLSVSGLTSGRGINYGRIAYEMLLNGQGTRFGGSFSLLDYKLGGALKALDARGDAKVESLWVKHPFARSRNINVYGQLQYDGLQLRDRLSGGLVRTDRHLDNAKLSLAGDARNSFMPGGISIWRLDWTIGRVIFDDGPARLADAATANTNGGFSKWNLNLMHLQSLGPKNSLYLSFSGQWANGNLDSSQKMIGGGPYTVRGYDMGAVSGDSGYLGTVEFRHDLSSSGSNKWQVVAFVDSAQLKLNHTTWSTGPNRATLSGAGVGLNWHGQNQWSAKLNVAVPIGATPSVVPNTSSARLWVELSKAF
ncbi:MAG: ShlB/FhaC/HecB family hemolysin secretion/activation protein [Candidatus Didemnitutus sp.]|nr:ShlB/FhaC/HecB family hemolysin secretion/activation protein [Candidatus Didemnitutus sp.]